MGLYGEDAAASIEVCVLGMCVLARCWMKAALSWSCPPLPAWGCAVRASPLCFSVQAPMKCQLAVGDGQWVTTILVSYPLCMRAALCAAGADDVPGGGLVASIVKNRPLIALI